MDNLLGGGGDGHHAAGALAVQRHAGHGGGQPGADQGLAGDVGSGRTLLQGGTDDAILDLVAVEPGAVGRVADGVADQFLRLGVVEGAAIGLADGGAGG